MSDSLEVDAKAVWRHLAASVLALAVVYLYAFFDRRGGENFALLWTFVIGWLIAFGFAATCLVKALRLQMRLRESAESSSRSTWVAAIAGVAWGATISFIVVAVMLRGGL